MILVTIEIILSVTTAVLISRKIGKKVYKPLHMIEKTGEGNFTARIVYDNRDEFAFFYKKLNEMNQNLQMLVHEKYADDDPETRHGDHVVKYTDESPFSL